MRNTGASSSSSSAFSEMRRIRRDRNGMLRRQQQQFSTSTTNSTISSRFNSTGNNTVATAAGGGGGSSGGGGGGMNVTASSSSSSSTSYHRSMKNPIPSILQSKSSSTFRNRWVDGESKEMGQADTITEERNMTGSSGNNSTLSSLSFFWSRRRKDHEVDSTGSFTDNNAGTMTSTSNGYFGFSNISTVLYNSSSNTEDGTTSRDGRYRSSRQSSSASQTSSSGRSTSSSRRSKFGPYNNGDIHYRPNSSVVFQRQHPNQLVPASSVLHSDFDTDIHKTNNTNNNNNNNNDQNYDKNMSDGKDISFHQRLSRFLRSNPLPTYTKQILFSKQTRFIYLFVIFFFMAHHFLSYKDKVMLQSMTNTFISSDGTAASESISSSSYSLRNPTRFNTNSVEQMQAINQQSNSLVGQPPQPPQQLQQQMNNVVPSSSIHTTHHIPHDPLQHITSKADQQHRLTKLRHLSSFTKSFNFKHDLPFLLDVPLSGTAIAKHAFAVCHHLIQACDLGLKQSHYKEDVLGVFTIPIKKRMSSLPSSSSSSETATGRELTERSTSSSQLLPHNHVNASYTNVDTSTITGLHRAQKLELSSRHQFVNVLSSPLLYETSTLLFTEYYPGRMFSIFRHPLDRAISWFDYIRDATWDYKHYNPNVHSLSLREYLLMVMNSLMEGREVADDEDVSGGGGDDGNVLTLESLIHVHNPMTRLLSGKNKLIEKDMSSAANGAAMDGTVSSTDSSTSGTSNVKVLEEVTEKDLELAKMVVAEKCLVGLYRDMEGAMSRFDRYFGWSLRSRNHRKHDKDGRRYRKDSFLDKENRSMKAKSCHADVIQDMTKVKSYFLDEHHDEPNPDYGRRLQENSEEWDLLVELNQLDLELYSYIEGLYEVQGDMIFGVV